MSRSNHLATLRIVAIYAFFAGIWILTSDAVVGWLVHNPVTMTRLAVFKGWLFVLLTSLLLYRLITSDHRILAEANARLTESEERFHTIYDLLSDAIFIHDAETGRILDVNDTMCRMYGYRRDEVLEQGLFRLGTDEAPYRDVEALEWIHQAAAGQPQLFEWLSTHKDGHQFWVEVSMRCAVLEGKPCCIVLVRDISKRKWAEEQLNIQQQQLEELNRTLEQRVAETVAELRHKDELLLQQSRQAAMGEMLNNIAHQWRQPLNNIAIYVQGIQLLRQSGELSDEQLASDVRSVMEIITYMSKTIDDFRIFFRQEKQPHPFDLKGAVNQALHFVMPRLEQHQINWRLVADATPTVIGYQAEYLQVLLNILDNAIDALKEQEGGEQLITVTIDRGDLGPRVTIEDSGAGVQASDLPHIFEPYFTTKGPGGSGIGLYMAKAIIEKHMAGRLKAANNPSGGARFTIELPG